MKRGDSGLSLLVAVQKPRGCSSHDVVNRCRRIFGERRCGHTGTLDPFATGVLPICIGPATRLDKFMTGHDKRYRVSIAFGAETTTDDCTGEVTLVGTPAFHLYDEKFARSYVEGLVGVHEQVPPRYCAVKVDGKKSYEVARGGGSLDLSPRRIEIYSAHLVEVCEDSSSGYLVWKMDVHVSKGTYIRSIARDMGRDLACPAHVAELERIQAGLIRLEDCTSLESLEELKSQAAIDPVRALGMRFGFADEYERFVNSGVALYPDQLTLYEPLAIGGGAEMCSCTSGIVASNLPPEDLELVAVVVKNRLKALYRYDDGAKKWKPECVFSIGIARC